MPRKRRFTKLNSCHHVMLRGNNGQLIFHNNEDKTWFCLILQKAAEDHQIAVHAFCLMNNHMHLILEPTTIPLSNGVKAFAGRYAQYFNYRYKQKGHVFQDRFRSILIEEGDYLKRLVRYIHLNPVRANLVTEPQNYRWSSYCTYLALEEITWLTQERVLRKFGSIDADARKAFIIYTAKKFEAELDVRIVHDSNRVGVFGGEKFLKELEASKIGDGS